MRKKILFTATILIVLSGLCSYAVFFSNHALAQTAEELQQKIDEQNNNIKKLEDEIAQYQAQLDKTSAEAKSLQTTVKSLDLNSKKLGTDIQVTQNKITTSNLTIQELGLTINKKESEIQRNQEVIRKAIVQINELDSSSLIEVLLEYPDASTFWGQIQTLDQLNSGMKSRIDELRGLKTELVSTKSQTEIKKIELESLKNQLDDQKTAVEITKQAKSELLSETKNKESNFKQIIADKAAKKLDFEKELVQYESKLKLFTDPKSIPVAHTGILAWPLDPHRITQLFGNTEFAQAHAAVYNGTGHNAIDIAAAIGTPIKSALEGTIFGTGDTDTACPGASFGKWVVVKHPNGLSTLYAHLSVIKVTQGQQVSTGDVLGYSGMTGYATGPHLHFTVYATQGMQIVSRPSKSCGGAVYTLPVADLKAYLNPMNYL